MTKTKVIRAGARAVARDVPGNPTAVMLTIEQGPLSLVGRNALLDLDDRSTRWLAEQLLLRAVERSVIPTHGLSLGDQRIRRERAALYVRGVFDEACAIARDGSRA